jgi:hypothetical protein
MALSCFCTRKETIDMQEKDNSHEMSDVAGITSSPDGPY